MEALIGSLYYSYGSIIALRSPSGKEKSVTVEERKCEALYRIGTSGYSYDDWKGRFYPDDLKRNEWLSFYARRFSTVELNVTFYRYPSESLIKGWNRRAPEGFSFAVKGTRRITHFQKLLDVGELLDLFWRRVRGLENLAVLLWQLPPSLKKDLDRLEAFLTLVPEEVLNVFEFRHESWFSPETTALLERYRCGFVSQSHPSLPGAVVPCSGAVYLRFHGAGKELYRYRYSRRELEQWAEKLRGVEGSVDRVFIYFNNDYQGNAVENAATLAKLLGVSGVGRR